MASDPWDAVTDYEAAQALEWMAAGKESKKVRIAAVRKLLDAERARAEAAERERDAACAERDALRAALNRFGHHSAGCATYSDGTWMHADAAACGCGLRAALTPPSPVASGEPEGGAR